MEMMMRVKSYESFKILFLSILLIFFFGCGEGSKARDSSIGKAPGNNPMEKGRLILPDFSLQDMEGREHRLADYIGEKPVLLVFWTTGCRFCIQEIPRLNKIFLDRADDLKLLSINILESKRVITRLMQAKGIQYPILMDPHGVTVRDYHIRGVPTVVVIDLNGNMGYYGHDLSEAMNKIEGLLS